MHRSVSCDDRWIRGSVWRPIATGTLAGLIATFFLSKFLGTILFGVTVHDPLTFVAVPACLIAIALLAGYLPARRATASIR